MSDAHYRVRSGHCAYGSESSWIHTFCRVTECICLPPGFVAIESTSDSLHFVRYKDLYGEVIAFHILLGYGNGHRCIFSFSLFLNSYCIYFHGTVPDS